MTLKLYMHPLSSYCHKALIAFYENDIPFEMKRTDDPAVAAALKDMWPVGKFPVLTDEARDWFVPESTIIIEYLAQHFPGRIKLIPDDPDLARQVRMRDRFFDLYLHTPMQKLIGDRLRPADSKDAFGVEEAKKQFATALGMLEGEGGKHRWGMGDAFTMADCAAAPALYFGNIAMPFETTHKQSYAYLRRLMERPSYARVLEEAKPFLHLVPK